MNSFGVFQTYYVDFLNHSPSDVSWIGSIQVFLTFFMGTFTGRLTDAGYFRPVFCEQQFLLSLLRATLNNDMSQHFIKVSITSALAVEENIALIRCSNWERV
jgi:hypothetical protein